MKVHKTKDRVRVEIKTEAEVLALQLVQLQGLASPAGESKEAAAARAKVIGERVADIEKRLEELDKAPAPQKRICFVLSPLTRIQKSEVLACVSVKGGQLLEDSMAMSAKAIKFSLKAVEGLENQDGTPYVLALGPDGTVTEEALDDLLNLDEASQVLMAASMNLAGTGLPDELRSRVGGNVLENVVVIKDPKA